MAGQNWDISEKPTAMSCWCQGKALGDNRHSELSSHRRQPPTGIDGETGVGVAVTRPAAGTFRLAGHIHL